MTSVMVEGAGGGGGRLGKIVNLKFYIEGNKDILDKQKLKVFIAHKLHKNYQRKFFRWKGSVIRWIYGRNKEYWKGYLHI